MDNVKRQILNNSESANRVNLIIILLFITLFLIIGVASIGFSLSNNSGSSDLKDFIAGATVTDLEGHPIEDGTLYVGEKYNIKLEFKEGSAQGIQFEPADGNKLTYQIPKNFSVDPIESMPLKITIDGEEKEIGTYSIDNEGKLTIELNEAGQSAINSSTDVSLTFDITVTTQPNPDGDDDKVHFGSVDNTFDLDIKNEAKVDVDKIGFYTEDAKGEDGKDPSGGTLSYTVKATVEHGKLHNATIKDVLTPPNNPNFNFHLQEKNGKPDVIVTLKHIVNGEEETITLTENDYELIKVKSETDDAYADQSFEVKIKEESSYNPLKDGDIVEVKYNYRVDYESGGEFFWDTVKNEAEVQGTYKIQDPTTGTEEEKPVKEHKENETGVSRTPVGGGKVVKGQEYDKTTNKLHYTVYAVVPKGNWSPFFLTDQINVTIDGVNYSLKEFKNGGRIGDISVSAMDLSDDQKKMTDSNDNGTLVDKLKEIKNEAKTLKGFDFENLQGYNPEDMDQYVYKKEDSILHIIFGLQENEQKGNDYWGRWGHYHNEKDRLIIIEYNLNLADGNVNLTTGQNKDTVSKSIDDVLHAGITNDINFRYGGYYPGYTTFYTNAEKIVKEGIFDKKTNTIDYTVTLNITDAEIREYLKSITKNWTEEVGNAHQWRYEDSMQAEFYDILPEGWEYVDKSLEAIVVDTWQDKRYPYCEDPLGSPAKEIEIEGQKRNVISAAIIFFKYTEGESYHELYAENFGNDNVKSITFHYKIKATEKYIAEHASIEKAIPVHNEAMIKDKTSTKWKAESDVDYFPTRLFKEASQEGSSNLIHFTLRVNPNAVNLNKDNNFLIVTDTSVGMQIQKDSIKVYGTDDQELTYKGDISLTDSIENNEWGTIILEDEDNKRFKLKIPDEKAIVIKYDALIENKGSDVQVSNSASIDGLVQSDTSYQGSLQVDNIYGVGEGNRYELIIEKVDEDQTSKKLKNAKFKFCIVIANESTLEKTNEYTIGGKTYECHRNEEWEFETNDNGQYKIKKEANWDLEPGNYYILEETDPPEGYMPLEEPILFYYGMESDMDKTENPKAVLVLPNTKITIKNEPVPYHIPATGGIGLKIFYTTGFLLTVLSLSLIWRKIRLKPTK